MEKFTRITQSKINRIKEIQLEMLKELDTFCRKNGIKYFLAYGSLLGAIRHGGYIPWDDDLDIWMLRDDFEKFRKSYFDKNNKLSTMSNTENYPFYMAKIINQNTKLIENGVEHIDFKYGVYIDVFVLDILPKSNVLQEIKLAINYLLYAKLKFKYSKTDNIFKKNICKLINTKKIEDNQIKLWKHNNGSKYKDDNTLYFLTKNINNKKYKFESCWFNEIIDYKFEDMYCMIPKMYDEILKLCYGDYMKLPPEDQREIHNFIEFEEIK